MLVVAKCLVSILRFICVGIPFPPLMKRGDWLNSGGILAGLARWDCMVLTYMQQ